MPVILAAICVFCYFARPAMAFDWDGCESSLHRLKKASAEAEEHAQRLAVLETARESAKDDLDRCRRDKNDDCHSKASDSEQADSEYKDELDQMRSAMADVTSYAKKVSRGCPAE